jgi:putative sporulation protein YtxC
MVLLSIGFTPEKCDVYGKLSEIPTYFKARGINIGLIESDSGEFHFVKCVICDEDANKCSMPEIKEAFNIYVSNILYQIIVDNFEIDILNRVIKENYYYFKPDEIQKIINKCLDVLKGYNVTSSDYYNLYLNRKNRIVNKILEYIIENTDIVLEGFLRFRLKELNGDLEDIVDKVVEEYLIEREYDEFIKLLKYFVEIQESRIEVVNIVIEDNGMYCMYDSNYNEITDELIRDLAGEVLTGEVSYDDLLVSSLITLAPRHIIIHNLPNIRNKEIIDTVKSVFTERIKICTGCDLCIKKSPLHRI